MKQKVIVRYDVAAIIAAMNQEIDAWEAFKAAERRAHAARQEWLCTSLDTDAERAAAKERDRAECERVAKYERYSGVGDMITCLCDAVNVDYKALYAVAKAFRRRNERDFWKRGKAAEWCMTEQNEGSFRHLVAGNKMEWV